MVTGSAGCPHLYVWLHSQTTHTLLRGIYNHQLIWHTCSWTAGESRSTWRKPTQAREECANSPQKGLCWYLNQEPSFLEVNFQATALPWLESVNWTDIFERFAHRIFNTWLEVWSDWMNWWLMTLNFCHFCFGQNTRIQLKVTTLYFSLLNVGDGRWLSIIFKFFIILIFLRVSECEEGVCLCSWVESPCV